MALIPVADGTIEHTWHVAGMQGTGSDTLVVRDVFVPAHRVMSVPNALDGYNGTPSGWLPPQPFV